MTKLDYEPQVPKVRRANVPTVLEMAWWMVCCFAGASAGVVATLTIVALIDHGRVYTDMLFDGASICGLMGGFGTMAIAVPFLLYVKNPRWRLLLSALLGFVITAGLLVTLWLTNRD